MIGWPRDEPALTLDAAAQHLAQTARIVAPTPDDAVGRARDYLQQLYRSLYDHG